ncbi:MAG: hypothetical protein NE327_18100 [Lentisphaeraceae bacterium]|nr:hypothetical protein [Lentisphaeraceae bacterium]
MSAVINTLDFDKALETSINQPESRKTYDVMCSFDIEELQKYDCDKHRPYLSKEIWALYCTYKSIIVGDVVKMHFLKHGLPKEFLKFGSTKDLVESVLPHQRSNLEKSGEPFLYKVLEELEEKILEEINNTIEGKNKDTIAVSAKILLSAKEHMKDIMKTLNEAPKN